MDKGIITLGPWLTLLLYTLATSTTTDAQESGRGFSNLTLLHTAVPKGAVCLDGSPPSYAYHEGFGSGSKSWIVFMEGGGWCLSKQDCHNRSTRYLGSSYHTEKEGVHVFAGILDTDSRLNPYFYNWHKFFIHYCDGSVYMSDVEQVELFQGSNLTFRGARIYNAMIEEMLNRGMRNAKNAILTGSSAGGLATILHCDRFRAVFPNASRVKCISDSGFFIRGKGGFAYWSERRFGQLIATHELVDLLPTSCTSKRDPNLCLFPEYLVGDVNTPLFLVDSTFDTFQIEYNLKISFGGPTVWSNCTKNFTLCSSTQLGILRDFRTIFIGALLELGHSSNRGMFVDSCYRHTNIQYNEGWMCSSLVGMNVLGNKMIGQAVADWFYDRSSFEEIDIRNELPQKCTNPFSPQLLEEKCRVMLSHSRSQPLIVSTSFILPTVVYVCLFMYL